MTRTSAYHAHVPELQCDWNVADCRPQPCLGIRRAEACGVTDRKAFEKTSMWKYNQRQCLRRYSGSAKGERALPFETQEEIFHLQAIEKCYVRFVRPCGERRRHAGR